MGNKRVKARNAVVAAVAALAGVLVASVAVAGAQGPGDYTTSTTTPPPTTTTTSLPARSIHYSLRFHYTGKHRRARVVARVYCHSIGCSLSARGQLRIRSYRKPGKAAGRVRGQRFRLGNARGTYPYRKGRVVAGRLSFRVPRRASRAVVKAREAGARGKVRARLIVTGSNTVSPTTTSKRRTRNVKLFCSARARRAGGRCTPAR